MKAFLKLGWAMHSCRADEAGAELAAHRPHLQIAGHQPAMADPAGDEDRDVGGERRQYLLGEHRGRDRADMAARLHALDHQGVDSRADQLLRQRQRRSEADQLGAVALDPVDRSRRRQPAGEDDMADLVPGADVDQLGELRMHGDEVDPERPLGPLLRLGDLGVEQLRSHRPAGDHPERAGVGQGRDEVALRDPAHRAAEDRDLAAEEVGARASSGGARRSWPMERSVSLMLLRHPSASWDLRGERRGHSRPPGSRLRWDDGTAHSPSPVSSSP